MALISRVWKSLVVSTSSRSSGAPSLERSLLASCMLTRIVAGNDMLTYLKRTTVKLFDDLDTRLRHQAKSKNITGRAALAD